MLRICAASSWTERSRSGTRRAPRPGTRRRTQRARHLVCFDADHAGARNVPGTLRAPTVRSSAAAPDLRPRADVPILGGASSPTSPQPPIMRPLAISRSGSTSALLSRHLGATDRHDAELRTVARPPLDDGQTVRCDRGWIARRHRPDADVTGRSKAARLGSGRVDGLRFGGRAAVPRGARRSCGEYGLAGRPPV